MLDTLDFGEKELSTSAPDRRCVPIDRELRWLRTAGTARTAASLGRATPHVFRAKEGVEHPKALFVSQGSTMCGSKPPNKPPGGPFFGKNQVSYIGSFPPGPPPDPSDLPLWEPFRGSSGYVTSARRVFLSTSGVAWRSGGAAEGRGVRTRPGRSGLVRGSWGWEGARLVERGDMEGAVFEDQFNSGPHATSTCGSVGKSLFEHFVHFHFRKDPLKTSLRKEGAKLANRGSK